MMIRSFLGCMLLITVKESLVRQGKKLGMLLVCREI